MGCTQGPSTNNESNQHCWPTESWVVFSFSDLEEIEVDRIIGLASGSQRLNVKLRIERLMAIGQHYWGKVSGLIRNQSSEGTSESLRRSVQLMWVWASIDLLLNIFIDWENPVCSPDKLGSCVSLPGSIADVTARRGIRSLNSISSHYRGPISQNPGEYSTLVQQILENGSSLTSLTICEYLGSDL